MLSLTGAVKQVVDLRQQVIDEREARAKKWFNKLADEDLDLVIKASLALAAKNPAGVTDDIKHHIETTWPDGRPELAEDEQARIKELNADFNAYVPTNERWLEWLQ